VVFWAKISIEELLSKIQNDSVLMLMSIMAGVVGLVIVLVIIISAMRVKAHKEKYWNINIDNKEKTFYIAELEAELQAYKIEKSQILQTLTQFNDTKSLLEEKIKTLSLLERKQDAIEKKLNKTMGELKKSYSDYNILLDSYEALRIRYDKLLESNTRYRTDNARILLKLKQEGKR